MKDINRVVFNAICLSAKKDLASFRMDDFSKHQELADEVSTLAQVVSLTEYNKYKEQANLLNNSILLPASAIGAGKEVSVTISNFGNKFEVIIGGEIFASGKFEEVPNA